MGWIKLHRKIQDNWLWEDKPFSKGQAWIDLLLLAEYEDNETTRRGQAMKRQRGEVHRSLSSLGERWGWSRAKVQRFMRALNRAGMCTLNSTANDTAITIENYALYQDVRALNDTADDTALDTADDTQLRNKEDKEYKNKRIDDNKNIKELYINNARARLGEEYEDVDRLMRVILERIEKRTHNDPIKDFTAYCLTVAETEGVKKYQS